MSRVFGENRNWVRGRGVKDSNGVNGGVKIKFHGFQTEKMTMTQFLRIDFKNPSWESEFFYALKTDEEMDDFLFLLDSNL